MFDIYQEITDRMIQQMESGIIPWQKPWTCGNASAAISHTTGKPYSILNQMILGRSGEYITFNQCKQEGGHVRKGEKSSMVVFWKFIETDETDESTGEKKKVPYLRFYNVFHIDQCEGIKPRYEKPADESTISADETAESIIAAYVKRSGVTMVNSNGDRAFYQPATDRIEIPMMSQFKENAEYYGTAFHEMVHSTGHASRLARLDTTAFFGSHEYSKEELVAEIGSAALVNIAGLETAKSFRNSAAYVQNWLSVLKNDKRFIISAAGRADKAVNMILGQ